MDTFDFQNGLFSDSGVLKNVVSKIEDSTFPENLFSTPVFYGADIGEVYLWHGFWQLPYGLPKTDLYAKNVDFQNVYLNRHLDGGCFAILCPTG